MLLLALAGGAAADLDRSDPLVVPAEPPPAPEDAAPASFEARVDAAAAVLRQHGVTEMPVLARALLDSAGDPLDLGLVDRAVEFAPHTPGVRFDAARLRHSPLDLVATLQGLVSGLPGLLWLAQLAGGALGIGVLVGAALVVAVALLRSLPQHAHALGHLGNSKDFPALPGVVTGLALLALLALLGVGPALLLGVAGAAAALRLHRREAIGVGLVLVMAGLCLGPLLDSWSRVVATQGTDSHLLAAWRADRSQPLPGDLERLSSAVERKPRALLLRVALGTAWKRRGDLDRAMESVGPLARNSSGELAASAYNLRGIISLARGEAREAIREFEAARSAHESAPVLFNLSQAYGRALRLMDQKPMFNAARELDRTLISNFTSSEGRSIHDYLIQAPLPLRMYLRQAFAADGGSVALVDDVRGWTLGPRVPGYAWALLPLLGIGAAFLRRTNIGRCRRCGRAICSDCHPELKDQETCVRCHALFGRTTISDPQVHAEQLKRDRSRQRRLMLKLGGAGLVLPGASDVYLGRIGVGAFQLTLAATAFFLLFGAELLPRPWAVGDLGRALPVFLGAAMLLAVYARALPASLRRFAEARALG